jgi:hypothetical protein
MSFVMNPTIAFVILCALAELKDSEPFANIVSLILLLCLSWLVFVTVIGGFIWAIVVSVGPLELPELDVISCFGRRWVDMLLVSQWISVTDFFSIKSTFRRFFLHRQQILAAFHEVSDTSISKKRKNV